MAASFGWLELVFYLAVAFGTVLAVGAALGVAHDGDGEGDSDDGLSLFALGRLPLAIRLMLLSFTFGGLGLIAAPLLAAILPGRPVLGGLLAVGCAAAGALVFGGAAARFLARRVPLLESETVRRAELVGATGRLVLPASEWGGVAQIRDQRGNLHQVICHLQVGDSPLPSGAEVLLVDYDAAAGRYLAARSPL